MKRNKIYDKGLVVYTHFKAELSHAMLLTQPAHINDVLLTCATACFRFCTCKD